MVGKTAWETLPALQEFDVEAPMLDAIRQRFVIKELEGASAGARQRYWRETFTAYAYLLPATLVLLTFHFLPIFYAFFISLNKWGILQERFVGLANYINLLKDADFWQSLYVTVWFVIGTVPVSLALSLLVAVLLFRNIGGRGIFRTLYFLPNITSVVAAGVVWSWIFNVNYGVLNFLLEKVGIEKLQWLQEPRGIFEVIANRMGMDVAGVPTALLGPSVAMLAIIIMTIWSSIGFNMIIFLAGLGNISKDVYEAARIDGASEGQVFWKVTLPLLSPTTFFLLVISVIRSFQAFNQIYAMTIRNGPAGGPLNTTRTVTVYVINTAFLGGNPKMGYASAGAFILFGIILLLTIIQFRSAEGRVQYE
jgi:multiple sugar transport system permease protein